ncbi:MAG TPA: LysR family transcriptional regulator [Sphingobium sp.]|uniref:LysR family transcriptional regulator n=1 Tax=Sphingobium sp. TaxID=1912891 RepID=UPI002ED3B91C
MQWDDLRFFLAVERAGTLSAAGSRLGVDATTVGRRVDRLAQSLGATLFEAGPQGHRLTEAGEQLLTHAEAVERAVLAATGDVGGESSRLAGTVRVSLPEGFATALVAPALPVFHAAHPGIALELASTHGFLNPSKREADIAIMLNRPTSGSLIVSKIGDYRLGLYASRSYVERHGMVTDRADLRGRTLIGYVPDLIFWDALRYLEEIDTALSATITSSSIAVQHAMTRAGVGLCVLHHFMAQDDLTLVPILPEIVITRTYWMVVHADLRRVARVAAVMDWLRSIAPRAVL